MTKLTFWQALLLWVGLCATCIWVLMGWLFVGLYCADHFHAFWVGLVIWFVTISLGMAYVISSDD